MAPQRALQPCPKCRTDDFASEATLPLRPSAQRGVETGLQPQRRDLGGLVAHRWTTTQLELRDVVAALGFVGPLLELGIRDRLAVDRANNCCPRYQVSQGNNAPTRSCGSTCVTKKYRKTHVAITSVPARKRPSSVGFGRRDRPEPLYCRRGPLDPRE